MEFYKGKFKSYSSNSLRSKVEVITPSSISTRGFLSTSSNSVGYDPRKYLYSHCTALVGARVDDNGYYILPGYENTVNAWGDVVTDSTLKEFVETFLESYVFFEHIHIDEMIKGNILDYFLYEMEIFGRPYTFVDVLMATDLKDAVLCNSIINGDINEVSQGCWATKLQCSQCGESFKDLKDICDHLKYNSNEWFVDPKGTPRVTCNILQSEPGNKESFSFFDVSWVYQGAYRVAVLHKLFNKSDAESVISGQSTVQDFAVKMLPHLSSLNVWKDDDLIESIDQVHMGSNFDEFGTRFIHKDKEKFVASYMDLASFFYTLQDVKYKKKEYNGMEIKDRVNKSISIASTILTGDARKDKYTFKDVVKSLAVMPDGKLDEFYSFCTANKADAVVGESGDCDSPKSKEADSSEKPVEADSADDEGVMDDMNIEADVDIEPDTEEGMDVEMDVEMESDAEDVGQEMEISWDDVSEVKNSFNEKIAELSDEGESPSTEALSESINSIVEEFGPNVIAGLILDASPEWFEDEVAADDLEGMDDEIAAALDEVDMGPEDEAGEAALGMEEGDLKGEIQNITASKTTKSVSRNTTDSDKLSKVSQSNEGTQAGDSAVKSTSSKKKLKKIPLVGVSSIKKGSDEYDEISDAIMGERF